MKIFLHIGLHKTGSTAIQSFLNKNRSLLLSKHKILYPNAGLHTVAHHLAAWSLWEPSKRNSWAAEIGFSETAEQVFGSIIQEAKDENAEAIILSSEEFSSVYAFSIPKLASLLKGYEVELIVYLRRQDEYLESSYGQAVKDYTCKTTVDFYSWLHERNFKVLDYHDYLSKWQNGFPNLIIKPRVYDRNCFPNKNINHDFLNAINTPWSSDYVDSKSNVNASLGVLSTKALIGINKIYTHYNLSRPQHDQAVKMLLEFEREDSVILRDFFEPSDRLEIIKQFEPCNQKLFKQFANGRNAFALDELGLQNQSQKTADTYDSGQLVNHKIERILTALTEQDTELKKLLVNKEIINEIYSNGNPEKTGIQSVVQIMLLEDGHIAWGQGNTELALDYYYQAVKINPAQPKAAKSMISLLLMFLAAGQAKSGNVAGRKLALETFLSFSPRNEWVLMELLTLLLGEGDLSGVSQLMANDVLWTADIKEKAAKFIEAYPKH